MGAVASCSDMRGWSLHMRIHQMDVQTAFLNGHLKEEIYMMQPEGSVKPGQEHLVCKLKKSLYGLKQSPKCWNELLRSFLISIGFCQADADPCVYVKEKRGLIILAVYVDDLIIASESENELHDLKKHFASQFKMKDTGELHYCLDVTIEQDHANDCIWMHQQQYVHRILDRYGLCEAKMYATPMDICTHL